MARKTDNCSFHSTIYSHSLRPREISKKEQKLERVLLNLGLGTLFFGLVTLGIVGKGNGPKFMGKYTDTIAIFSVLGGIVTIRGAARIAELVMDKPAKKPKISFSQEMMKI